jgi:hypothetical protein
MSPADGRDLIAAVTALAASLWQYSHPPEVLAELYVTDPRLAHAATDFTPRLEHLTHAVILGLTGESGQATPAPAASGPALDRTH